MQSNQLDPLPQDEDNRAIAYFESACEAFQRAEQAGGVPVDRFYAIAGHTLWLRFANPSLVPLITPALEHLALQSSAPSPDLTVCLWDSASTGVSMPAPVWSCDDCVARGEVRGHNDHRVFTAYQMGSGVLSMLDSASHLAVHWIRDARQLPYYESGAPLRTILHWFMDAHKCQFAHAASVGMPSGGVLLVGKSGSGKSTAALACLSSDLCYVGDDYVLLRAAPTPHVYSLYNSAKLDSNDIPQRLPHLSAAVGNSKKLDTEKALLFLHDHCPDKVAAGFPVRAILLPRVTGLPETRLMPTSPAASLAALAPTTIFQLPGAGHGAFQFMAQFVRQLPSYTLELGTDLATIPDVIIDLLSE